VADFCAHLSYLVRECRVQQTEIAAALGKSKSSVSELLSGDRRKEPDWGDVQVIVRLCSERHGRPDHPPADVRLDVTWWRGRHAELVRTMTARRAAARWETTDSNGERQAVARSSPLTSFAPTIGSTAAKDASHAIGMNLDEAVQLLAAGRADMPRTAHALLGEVSGKPGLLNVLHALLEGFPERVRAEHGVQRGALLQAARLVLAAAALGESDAHRGNRAAPRQLVESLMKGTARAHVWSGEGQQPADPVLLAATEAALFTRHQDFLTHYFELSAALAAVCPEFALVAGLSAPEGSAGVGTGLSGLEKLLAEFSGRLEPSPASQRLLNTPVARLDVRGPRVPTLADGYVNPRFRLPGSDPARVADHDVASEKWWNEQPLHEGIDRFLAAYLLSLPALVAPLLVLGDPGAGKSLFTKLLEARLLAGDFRPLRVELRRTPAEADIQVQLEHALRQMTGRSVNWPDWSESEPDTIPVVLLDGFDELLQAGAQQLSTTQQWGYLRAVAEFQCREAQLNRPLIVVVTSRTVVADRAELPPESQVLRLEPFHEPEIRHWLTIWNTTNSTHLERHALRPLTFERLGRQLQLAAQPLLLLMLALFDIEGNALQRLGVHHHEDTQLYEQLLREFVRRQVEKDGSLPASDQSAAVDRELRRLSVVALGIFQRGVQSVTGEEADRDLAALIGTETPESCTDRGLLFGRFFFVHEARAVVAEQRLRSYEFMHATFGEHLAARLVDRALRRLALTRPSGGELPDDSELYAALSFAPLTDRTQIVVNLRGMLSHWKSPTAAAAVPQQLAALFRAAPWDTSHRTSLNHAPVQLTRAYRDAVYTANLLLIAVLAANEVHASTFLPGDGITDLWRRQAMMWQSQLSANSWDLYSSTLSIERFWHSATLGSGDPREELRISTDRVPFVHHELSWALGFQDSKMSGPGANWLTEGSADELSNTVRRVMFVGDQDAELLLHVAYPLLRQMPSSLRAYHIDDEGQMRSAAQSLVALLTQDVYHFEVLPDLYDRCLSITEALSARDVDIYINQVFRQLIHDIPSLTDKMLASILCRIAELPELPAMYPREQHTLLTCLNQALERETDDRELHAAITAVKERISTK